MIERYRDGVVPDARVDSELAARRRSRLGGASPRGSTRSTSRARSTRRGSSCARSTASSRSARRGCSPRATTPSDGARLDETLRTLADGVRVLGSPALRRDARDARRACSPRSARPADASLASAPERRPASAGAGRRVGSAALPARRVAARRGVIDTHAHLQGLEAAPTRRSRRRPRRASTASSASATRRSSPTRGARALRRATPGCAPTVGLHPHRAEAVERRRAGRARRACSTIRASCRRRVRPRLLPRSRASRERAGARVRGPGRAGRASPASRS